MNLFSRRDGRIKHQLKLVSIHIPKTAGTSFRNTLKEVYQPQKVIRLDIHLQDEVIRIDEQVWNKKKLDSEVEVAHGHFSPFVFEKLFRTSPTLFITWLRHPVERVISNFYYLEKRLHEELDEQSKGLNILSKMQRTLMEYAADPLNQNRMTKFLHGKPLDDFAFVGIQEHYLEDLQQLGKQLGWQQTPHFQHNTTGKVHSISVRQREEIARFNQDDMALYEAALALRKKRLQAL